MVTFWGGLGEPWTLILPPFFSPRQLWGPKWLPGLPREPPGPIRASIFTIFDAFCVHVPYDIFVLFFLCFLLFFLHFLNFSYFLCIFCIFVFFFCIFVAFFGAFFCIFCIFVIFFPDLFSVCVVSVPVGPYLDVLCHFCAITVICRFSLRPKSGDIWRCFC